MAVLAHTIAQGLIAAPVVAIAGHQDLRMLRRYTHLKAEDLARKLD